MRTFTATYHPTLTNPGLPLLSNFNVSIPGNKIKLKSILITRRILNTGTGVLIQDENNTTQDFYLRVGITPGTYTGSVITTLGANPTTTGSFISIFKPGQYFFNWDVFANEIPFEIYAANMSAGTSFANWIDLLIEVENKIVYF